MSRDDLELVNELVNRGTRYRSDPEKFGTPEWWAAADGEGDCEDYAIAKLRWLVGDGWPISRLRLACCYVEDGGYHCVLIASAEDGDYMLDNRQPRIVPVGDIVSLLGYRPDKIQSAGGSRQWVAWIA